MQHLFLSGVFVHVCVFVYGDCIKGETEDQKGTGLFFKESHEE